MTMRQKRIATLFGLTIPIGFALLLLWQVATVVVEPAFGQTVTVDSTQSPVVLEAVADIATMSANDGQMVIIKTGAEQGLWRYSKTSSDSVGTGVLNGPGSVGRLLAVSNSSGTFSGIDGLTNITADEITDDTAVEFGVLHGSSAKALSLAELKKTGVQVVNVKQYGAVGDGVTDDTAAIQDAIDSLAFAGGVVYFPEGRYPVSSTITIGDKGPLFILGQSTNLMKGTSAAHSSQIVPDASFGTTTAVFDIVSDAANNTKDHGGVTFKDIMIRPASGVRGYAINVRKGSGETGFWGDIRLDNVCIRQSTVGLRLTNSGGVGFGWIYVIGSRIEACTYGVWADCSLNSSVFRDSIIRQNTESANSSYTSRTGGGLVLPYGDAIVIEGCDLEANQVAIQSGASNLSIHGNYMEQCHDASIVLQAAEHVSIVGNLFASDRKTKQVYLAGCVDVIAQANENATPVFVGSNRDVFFDGAANAMLSCIADGGITAATQTISNVSAMVWSEQFVAKLAQLGIDAIKKPSTTPGGTVTNWTQGTEGPLGRTSLVGIATSESSKTYFNVAYADLASAAGVNGTAFTVDAGTDVITASGHGFLDGDQVCFYTAGTLPTGISTATWYYVRDRTSTTFKIATTHGGTAIDITSTGSGTLYVTSTGEYVTQNFWLKAPKTNTGAAPYIEHRRAIHGSGGSTVFYIGTPSSIVFPKDTWLLVQIVEKLPVGVSAGSGGYDCNLRIYQTTVGDVTHVSGTAVTKSRTPFSRPRYMYYFTDVSGENFLEIDERHYLHSAAPTSTVFSWPVGAQVEYLAPTAGGKTGKVCTTAGTPGTWKEFGAIDP